LSAFQPDNEPIAAPNLHVVTVNQALRVGYGLAVVPTNQRLKTYEVPVGAKGISPVLCHPRLLQRPQFAGKKVGDLRGPQQVIAIAVQALKSATARLPKQEARGFAAFWTDGWRGVFGHDDAGSGVSTSLTVTD